MGHRVCLHPSCGYFHHHKHMALAIMGLGECDPDNLPGLPVLAFQPSSSTLKRFYPLRLLDCSMCLTFMENLKLAYQGTKHL